jgi:hypothetical protein
MTKVMLVFGEDDDGWFRTHPPENVIDDEVDCVAHWAFCFLSVYEEELRELFRYWRQERGMRVLLHVSWNPGDANAQVTVLATVGIGKPYRLMKPVSELAADGITPGFDAIEEFPYPLKDLLEWLPVEGEEGEEEREALFDEIMRRGQAGEISKEDFQAVANLLRELSEESKDHIQRAKKLLARQNLRVVEPN